MKRLLLLAAMLLVPGLLRAQNTFVTATITDPNGNAYTFLTGAASINCPGNQAPLFNGYSLARTIPIVGGDGNGHFTMSLWDVNAITPSGCSWNFAITWKDGITAFTAIGVGASGSGTPITGSGPVDLSAPISAFAVLLPNSTSGSVVSCTTTGGVAYERGLNNSLSCDANNVWNAASQLLTLKNLSAGNVFTLTNPTAATGILNQSSPIFTIGGTYWTGAASAADTWTFQNVASAGTNPVTTMTLVHSGSSGNPAVNLGAYPLSTGAINSAGMTSSGNVNILDAMSTTYQSSNNAMQTVGESSELLTLSLASAHTDTSGNLLPAGAIIDSVVIYVVQTISGGSTPTTMAIGDAGTSNRFISTGTPLTAGSSAVGLNQIDAGTSSQASAAKVRVTLDQIPGQGMVRITVFWRSFTAPTS